jgi:hypothetical protein
VFGDSGQNQEHIMASHQNAVLVTQIIIITSIIQDLLRDAEVRDEELESLVGLAEYQVSGRKQSFIQRT